VPQLPPSIATSQVSRLSVQGKAVYPKPCTQHAMLPKWPRAKLDEAISLRHGLLPVGGLVAENIAELI
jgi:hypothetical protein